MKKLKFRVKGSTDMLPHKFNGLAEEKRIKEMPEAEQAEKHAYRHPNGNLAIPCEWFRGCIVNNFIDKAGAKTKTSTKNEVAPRLRVEPALIDLGIKDYEIDIRSVPSGGRSGGIRDFCVRPRIGEWEAEFTLVSLLKHPVNDIKRSVEVAGVDIGIGSNRVNGFGRFEVVSCEEVKQP